MNKQYIMAIDQGTSGTKTLVFDEQGKMCAKATETLHTQYLDEGFVEQDPEEIFINVLSSVKQCLQRFEENGGLQNEIVGCGISNQRETFLVWDKKGKPLHPAIVWQCKRSINICKRLYEQGYQEFIKRKTGLRIDPYFSATKLVWLYENNDAVRKAIDRGEAYFGTIDTWLLWKLTNGRNYFTDYTNASRTLFFNLVTLSWDQELLDFFKLSKLHLPECRSSSFHFGDTNFNSLLNSPIPVGALIGDSHAAAFGEGCFEPGTAKATLGTGCSVLLNIGDKISYSGQGMVTTICWSTSDEVQYALEGVIVSCGATIEWLKTALNLFADSSETAAMAAAVGDNQGVYLIPAFSGLGAPHWDMNRRAAIKGLSFSSNKNHIVRAALESIPYQIKDILLAMELDTPVALNQLMIDGGMIANSFIVQFLADLIEKPVLTIGFTDISALGAAYLAGLNRKVFKDLKQLAGLHAEKKIIKPSGDDRIKAWYRGWLDNISHTRQILSS